MKLRKPPRKTAKTVSAEEIRRMVRAEITRIFRTIASLKQRPGGCG
jgi:hypothetical protein